MSDNFQSAASRIIDVLVDTATLIGAPIESPLALHSGAELQPGLGLINEANDLTHIIDDFQRGIFRVIVAGDFNNGKSTLLNALIGENVLPTGSLPVTPFITVIEYGIAETVAVHRMTIDGEQTIEPWRLKDFQRHFRVAQQGKLTDEMEFADISRAVIQRPLDWLSSGVQLVDTPGLSENPRRSQLTLEYLKRAHVIIMVMNATQFMSQEEEAWIERLYTSGRLSRVFFVINHMDKLTQRNDVTELVENAKAHLSEYFLDDFGQPDQALLDQRVFFLSALQAVKANQVQDAELWEASGIGNLSGAITNFLSASSRLDTVRAAARDHVIAVSARAYQSIQLRQQVIQQPLSSLEARRAEVEQQLKGLEGGVEQLQTRLYEITTRLREEVYTDLNAYLETLKQTWQTDSRAMFKIEKLVPAMALKATDAKAFNAEIQKNTREYLEAKFSAWGKRLPEIVLPFMEQLLRITLMTARAFELTLSEADQFFASTQTQAESAQLIRRIIELFSDTTNQSWMDVIQMRMKPDNPLAGAAMNALFIAVQMLMRTPLLVVGAALGTAVGLAEVGAIYTKWGEQLFEALEQEIRPREAVLYHRIEQNIRTMIDRMIPLFRREIDQVRANQQRLIAQISDEGFQAQIEANRLDQINQELLNNINRLNEPDAAPLTAADLTSLFSKQTDTLEPDAKPAAAPTRPAYQPKRRQMLNVTQIEYGLLDAQTWIEKAFGINIHSLDTAATAEDILNELDQLIGLEPVKARIRKLVAELQFQRDYPLGLETVPNRHMVFLGNPGTGKTTVARKMGQIFKVLGLLKKGHLIDVSRSDLVGQYIGATAIKTREVINSALDGVLFIDEAYTLAQTDAANDFGKEAIAELVKAITDHPGRLLIILAGYPSDMRRLMDSNAGLLSRFPYEIQFPDYTTEELTRIALHRAGSAGMVITEEARRQMSQDFEALRRRSRDKFGNAREIETYLQEVVTRIAQRAQAAGKKGQSEHDARTVRVQDLPSADGKIRSVGSGLEERLQKLETMIGLQPVKERLRLLTTRLEFLREYGNPDQERGALHMMFVGNPGTGKTTVARLVGEILRELGVLASGHLVEVQGRELTAKYLGQTAQTTNEYIQRALDGVLFIDEAYTLFSPLPGDYGSEALGTLVAAMENYRDRLVVIMAGYSADMLPILEMNVGLRGRFADIIEFPNYTPWELLEIMRQKAIAKNYTLLPDVEERVQAYLTQQLRDAPREFANGRSVIQLLDKMIDRLASRIMRIEDRAQRDRLARTFEPADIPDYVPIMKKDTLVIVVKSSQKRLSFTDLLLPASADRMR